MTSLTFLTLPHEPLLAGTPTRADHCRCARSQRINDGDGGCARCGRWTLATIARTWQARAQQMSEPE